MRDVVGRAHVSVGRKGCLLVPARETSGLEVRSLSASGHQVRARAWPPPWIHQTLARTAYVFVVNVGTGTTKLAVSKAENRREI